MQAQNKVEQTTNREALWIGENKTNAFYFRWKVTTCILHKITLYICESAYDCINDSLLINATFHFLP